MHDTSRHNSVAMSATNVYGNPNLTYPPPPETSAYQPPPAYQTYPPAPETSAYPAYPTYPPAPVNPAYPPPPTYQPPPTSQPVTASTSSLTVVNTAPTPVTNVTAVNPSPQNYLVLNIITLLCCCFVFGLIGMMYSLKVDSEWNRGNHQGAYYYARVARNWGMAGIITGVVIIIVVSVVIRVITATA